MDSRAFACFIALLGVSVSAQVSAPETPAPRPADVQPRSNIICGTSIFQAHRAVDPKMARTVPQGQFTLRTMQPPVCRDTFPASRTALMQRLPQIFGPRR